MFPRLARGSAEPEGSDVAAMGDQLDAGLTGRIAPVGWVETKKNSNKHKDFSQAGTPGECRVVDTGYATRDAGALWRSFIKEYKVAMTRRM